MNKTVIFITFAALAAIGLVGSIVLYVFRPDATATFTSQLVVILGLVASAAGTFYALGKQGDQLKQIEKQTNGALSVRDAHIAALTEQVIESGGKPVASPVGIVTAVVPPAVEGLTASD